VVILYMQYVFNLSRKKSLSTMGMQEYWSGWSCVITNALFLQLELAAVHNEQPLLEYPARHALSSFQHSCVLVQIISSSWAGQDSDQTSPLAYWLLCCKLSQLA
jgi:hypothetical protein